ncbi:MULTISPECIES: hypothetical protein [Arthrobacter]|uniref:Secreted protein n=1 Tax=Arthrobacter jinronghuae TaxID=2964609 RepID=A0ABT1NRJ6_9MICC|nr:MULTISPECIES: hypothetical protein [Arthrobacter]MCC3291313.1 hypothetical protein [Arthrobacter sp. zg-Y1110]MCC3301303.1 hypothetical protein [Arthrobacter sp. zg-Y895]MCC3302550.1 hypothetical protein [Arthrobacter sp. zg-Y895]MCC9174526.1 hypothetical protein [Arthrobacter sp. zg-Y179]MCQ1947139.1 hypothetical protein [Arthrobacter sp. zg-Y1116]
MIKRVFWMSIGVAIGVIAVRRVSEAKTSLSQAGINRAVDSAAGAVQSFAEALREGMGQREGELRAALGLDNSDNVAETLRSTRR